MTLLFKQRRTPCNIVGLLVPLCREEVRLGHIFNLPDVSRDVPEDANSSVKIPAVRRGKVQTVCAPELCERARLFRLRLPCIIRENLVDGRGSFSGAASAALL